MTTIIIPAQQYNCTQRKVIIFAYEHIHEVPRENRSRHVSILTAGKYILTYGVNREKVCDDKAHSYVNKSIHSEYECLRKFRRMHLAEELNKLTLWNVRINKWNEVKLSRPCRVCREYLRRDDYFPKRVFYTNDEGIFEEFVRG